MTDISKVRAMQAANWKPSVQYWRERAAALRTELDRAEARVAEVTAAGTFAQGIEAAAAFVDGFAPFNRIEGFPDMIRALPPTPQADPVRKLATKKMVDAAFKALPPDAHGTIGTGEMYRVIEAALAQKEPANE